MYLGELCAIILNQLVFTSVICLRVTHRHPVEFVASGYDKKYCLKLGPFCVCVVLVQVLLLSNVKYF